MSWETRGRLVIASHLSGPIKLSSQSTAAGVRLSCAFYQPQNPGEKCQVETIFAS